MRITRLDPADDGVVRACHAVWMAAREADNPSGPPLSPPLFLHWLTRGWNSNPCEAWVAADEATGQVLGFYRLDLPDLENRDRTHAAPVVHPALRRRGTGTALLRHAIERARANGRSFLRGEAQQGSAGEPFARQAGAEPGMVDAQRVLALRTVPPGKFAALRAAAAEKAAGYTLVSWTGPTPDEHLAGVGATITALNDAPHDPGREDNVWDARRVRERGDAIVRAGVMHGYSIAAIADAGGEVAGLTQVFVDPEFPEWGHQGITAVTRPHRGHRLGMLTKAAMLEWLAQAEPKLERIATDNAASNSYMISVNEALGYELAGPGARSYQLSLSPG